MTRLSGKGKIGKMKLKVRFGFRCSKTSTERRKWSGGAGGGGRGRRRWSVWKCRRPGWARSVVEPVFDRLSLFPLKRFVAKLWILSGVAGSCCPCIFYVLFGECGCWELEICELFLVVCMFCCGERVCIYGGCWELAFGLHWVVQTRKWALV